jgi:predicted MFS family arabinose efflux permease
MRGNGLFRWGQSISIYPHAVPHRSTDMNNKTIIVFICLGNIAISFNTGAVAAAIPLMAADFHASDFLVAKIVPYYMIPYGLGALLYAPLTRFFSYRAILTVAMTFFAVSSGITGISRSLSTMFLAQIGAGIAASSSTPLGLMMIGDFFKRDIRGRFIGMYFGCSFFASVVGMIFMGTAHWRWLYLIPALLGAATALCWAFFNQPLVNQGHKGSINYLQALSKPAIRNVFLFIFAVSFLYHAVHKWYGVFLMREYGLDKGAISFILIVAALAGLTGQQIGGYLSDTKGRLITCYVGIGALAGGTMLLSIHFPIALIVGILTLIAIGWTISHNSVSTVLTDFPDNDRPLMASLNSSVRFISGGVGFSISKFFVAESFNLTFFGIGVLILLLIFFINNIIHIKH